MEKGGLSGRLAEEGIAVDNEAKVWWADEMRLGLISQVRKRWAPIGIKIIQKIQISYKYTYLHLAVDVIKGTITWIWAENMKQESVVNAVTKWQESGVEAIIWDGAPSHRSHNVKTVGPVLIIQPPYAPELNPAERIFEEIRREVEGSVYATLDDKQKVVETFLKKLASSPERIRQLTGWKWIHEALGSPSIPAT